MSGKKFKKLPNIHLWEDDKQSSTSSSVVGIFSQKPGRATGCCEEMVLFTQAHRKSYVLQLKRVSRIFKTGFGTRHGTFKGAEMGGKCHKHMPLHLSFAQFEL